MRNSRRGNLIEQLVEEFIDVASDDEVEEFAIEIEDNDPEQRKVISCAQAKEMVTDLIAFAKAKSLFKEEMDLLAIKATIQSLYFSTLKKSSIDQYFQ